ncbi:MAG TPA: alpha/beta fold hydrolase [Allosphingosinicella sp.]|nr:alpha/beta fold hydrolase [Allosphingosinicella sp.]
MGTEADEPPLIVLPGGLGIADGGGEALHILGLGRRLRRVEYSGASDFDGLFERVLSEAAGAARVDLIGFSIGGWFAQSIAARAPERVRKIVLAHSFLLEPKHRWRFSAALKLWPLLPRSIVRAGIMRRARLALEPLSNARPEAHAQMVRAVAEALAEPGVLDGLLTQQRVIRDSLANPLGALAAPMLIIDSSTDPLVDQRARAELRRHYPRAEHVDFAVTGHVSALVAPEVFAATVDRFLRS